jgi:hypothetical protein
MVETIVAGGSHNRVRMVVDNSQAADYVRDYFSDENATTTVHQVGEDYHILVDLKA